MSFSEYCYEECDECGDEVQEGESDYCRGCGHHLDRVNPYGSDAEVLADELCNHEDGCPVAEPIRQELYQLKGIVDDRATPPGA